MKRILTVLIVIALAFLGWGYANAVADPVVRRAGLTLPEWPSVAPPLRVVLLSDVHVAGPDMSPGRLTRIVAQINVLEPEMVLIAGDFVSDKRVSTQRFPVSDAVAPLRRLRSRFGTIAVLGNHDHWRDARAFRKALAGIGVTVLNNRAIRRGPIILAGVDDDFTGHSDIAALTVSMSRLPGPVVALSHSPDVAPALPSRATLVLAGHTHCGQIALPFFGRFATMSRLGDRYACGVVREAKRTVIIGAGLGTSLLPLRYGAPPDVWLLTLGGTR